MYETIMMMMMMIGLLIDMSMYGNI